LAIRPTTGVYTNANGYFFSSITPPTPEKIGDDTVIGYVIDERDSDAKKVIFYFKPMEYEGFEGHIEAIYINGESTTNIYGTIFGEPEPSTAPAIPTEFGYAVFDYPGAGKYIKIDELHINVGGFIHPVLYDVYLSVEN
jgi:hypothetical protein